MSELPVPQFGDEPVRDWRKHSPIPTAEDEENDSEDGSDEDARFAEATLGFSLSEEFEAESEDDESDDEAVQATPAALDQPQTHDLNPADLNAIDRSEDQIERGEVHHGNDIREQVRKAFLGKSE
ncbi:MAG TPA: hypothetical protein VG326_13840 [Tepidisphaeraceae bacterium]|jgi:hypothetical protein|nr:hypothetical protein [Tepidisphaeraceae bacterium]